jgi:hypothetical protein
MPLWDLQNTILVRQTIYRWLEPLASRKMLPGFDSRLCMHDWWRTKWHRRRFSANNFVFSDVLSIKSVLSHIDSSFAFFFTVTTYPSTTAPCQKYPEYYMVTSSDGSYSIRVLVFVWLLHRHVARFKQWILLSHSSCICLIVTQACSKL